MTSSRGPVLDRGRADQHPVVDPAAAARGQDRAARHGGVDGVQIELSHVRELQPEAVLARGLDRLWISGIGVAQDADRRVDVECALQPRGAVVGAGRDDGHPGALRVAGIAAAARVQGDQVGARRGVQQRVEQRPVARPRRCRRPSPR